MDFSALLPILLVLSPLIVGSVIILVSEDNTHLRTTLNLGGAVITLVLVGILLLGTYSGGEFESRFPLLPNIDLVLHADSLSLLFVSLSAFLWLLTTVYAVGYFKGGNDLSRFFGFFSFCVGATIGIALAGNLVTFVIFYELLTLTTYPLIAHKGTPAAIRAARIYLKYTFVGGAVLLVGVVWLKTIAGPLEFTSTGVLSDIPGLSTWHLQIIFVLLIAGLGVKAALFPLHGWLPISMAAPAPVSALLHAVAVVKAGVFGIVRVVYDVYGVEFSKELGLTMGLAVVAGITIVYGSILALKQDDLKKRLAYSTVSQASYIVLGAAIAGPVATIGGLVHLVHQGLMKITLFFCAGSLAETLHVHKVSEMNGAGKRMPLTMAAFTVAAMGMIGMPPLAGFVSKWYLGVGALEAGAVWVIGVLAISSLLNACYFLPIIHAIWFKPVNHKDLPKPSQTRLETHWMLLLPPLLTALSVILTGLFSASALSPLSWAKLIALGEYGSGISAIADPLLAYKISDWLSLALPTLFIVALLLVGGSSTVLVRLIPLAAFPALIISYSTDSLSFLDSQFLMVTSALWLIVAFYAQSYLRNKGENKVFYVFFLLTMLGNFGVILSQDIAAFISFFTIMSLSAYPLILHSGEHARQAAKSYIQWVVVGEVLLFSGLAGTAFYTSLSSGGSTSAGWVAILLALGFGVKAGLLPLHVWLPKAHPIAPIPVSALLSAVMVKVGVLGWLRFLPLGEEVIEPIGMLMICLGLAGAYAAALYGVFQSNAKAVLAYSTISQLGIIAAMIGFVSLYPSSWMVVLPAIIVFVIHHAFAKASLFLSVGLIDELARKTWYRPLIWGALIIPALSLMSLPLSSGAVAKHALKTASSDWPMLASLISLTAIGTALLMCRFLQLLRASVHDQPRAPTARPRIGMVVSTLAPTVLSITYFYLDPNLRSLTVFEPSAWWSMVWPAAVGIIVYGMTRSIRVGVSNLPAGDLFFLYAATARELQKVFLRISRVTTSLWNSTAVFSVNLFRRMSTVAQDSIQPRLMVLTEPGFAVALVLMVLLYSFVQPG